MTPSKGNENKSFSYAKDEVKTLCDVDEAKRKINNAIRRASGEKRKRTQTKKHELRLTYGTPTRRRERQN